MQNTKEYFLSMLGINDFNPAILVHNVKLQRPNEREPFGEIVTLKNGKTVLRVGATYEDGIKVIV